MDKIPVTVSEDHYKADACVVWCFDDRFSLALEELIRVRRLNHVDRVIVAGGAKALGVADEETKKDVLIREIGTSIKLHGAGRVILMTHADCGAFGGRAAFHDDAGEELQRHREILVNARQAVKERFPEAEVETLFVSPSAIITL